MAAIDTGNPYDDFPANLHAVLDATASKTAIGHVLTFATIIRIIPTFPAICVEFDSATYVYEDPLFDQRVWCNVYYVQSGPGQAFNEDDIREALGNIFDILHDDANCNEYSEGRLQEAEIEVAQLVFGRDSFEDQPGMAGGRLQVMYPKRWKH